MRMMIFDLLISMILMPQCRARAWTGAGGVAVVAVIVARWRCQSAFHDALPFE